MRSLKLGRLIRPLLLLLGAFAGLGSATAEARIRKHSGIRCHVDLHRSSFGDGVATFAAFKLVQPMGITTMRGDRDVHLICPVTLDPARGVGFVGFWVYDRHPNFDARCVAELLNHEGQTIDSRVVESSGSSEGVTDLFADFRGQRGHTMLIRCSVPRRSDQSGVSILASYAVDQP